MELWPCRHKCIIVAGVVLLCGSQSRVVCHLKTHPLHLPHCSCKRTQSAKMSWPVLLPRSCSGCLNRLFIEDSILLSFI